MNLQVISSPDGTIVWMSGALRGSTHDLTAARTSRRTLTGLTPGSAPPASAPTPQLKTWHILHLLRCCPWRAGHLAEAIHLLQTSEIAGL
jgi:hypothetical protein